MLACLLTLDKIECFMEKRMSAVKSEIFSKLRFCCPLRASINKLLYSSIIVFLEKSTLLPKKHKKDIKSLLSLSGNKRLQAIKKSQLLQNTALWKASFILSTLYSSFICLIVFASIIYITLTILTWKNLCFTEFSTKTNSDVFHMFTQSIKFF